MFYYRLKNTLIWKFNLIYYFIKNILKRITFEKYLFRKIIKENEDKDKWILDIGANIGQKTIEFLSINQKVNIALFEPYAKYVSNLNLKFKNFKNIKIFNHGIDKTNKTKKFFITNEKENSEAFSFKKMPYHQSSINYKVKSIDSLKFFKKKKIFLMKIDVEQLEIDVMIGAIKTIIKYKPYIFFETTNKYLKKIKIFFKNIEYNLLPYEYYFFKDNQFVFNDPIYSWRKKNVICSNIYKKKFYNIDNFCTKKSFMLNVLALPKDKIYLFKNNLK